jgi:hypothetical protein
VCHQLTPLKADSVFSGISTFGRLPYFPCLASDEEKYDIAFIGMENESCVCNTWRLIRLQELHLTRELRTDQVPALAPAALDKVLVVSISSTCLCRVRNLLLGI